MNTTDPKTKAYIVTVSEEAAGQRLDNFLARLLKTVPKTHRYRLIRTGAVRVNKGRKKADYKLCLDDQIRIPPLQAEDAPRTQKAPPSFKRIGATLLKAVLYEDEHLLILNKPAGIAVHGGSGLTVGVIEALRQAHPRGEHLELVHRLDRETSGCLMIAKRRAALRGLHEQLRTGKHIQKKYRCLVQGQWPGSQLINFPLQKNTLHSGERMVKVSETGLSAETRFTLIKAYPGMSLMEAMPITGRTHQIRVHAAASRHPIAGDEKYGSLSFNKQLKKVGLTRLFLHAYELQLVLPYNGQKIRIIAPLDNALMRVLAQLNPTGDPHDPCR